MRPAGAAAFCAVLVSLTAPGPVRAQRLDTSACGLVGSTTLCAGAGELAAVLTAHGPMIAAAGNPVPGTASTLGKRMPGTPRITIAIRRTAGSTPIPAAAGIGTSTSASAWSGDVAIGVLDGLSAMSTVGGLFSLDILGSVSLVRFPSSDGFRSRTPSSWAAGVRLGVLRESFTLPGVSVSVMNRRTGRLTFGDPALEIRDLYEQIDGVSTWSARATAGKRLGVFGFTGGLGYDRHSGRGEYRIRASDGAPAPFAFTSLHARRGVFFGGVSWTTLVFNLSAEAGRQSGSAGAIGAPAGGGWFWGLAARLTF